MQGMSVSEENPFLAEEMMRGMEHIFESMSMNGKPVTWSVSDYLPTCLDVVENPWIQWACILPREENTPVYQEAAKMGTACIEALGLDNGFTHMEWFEKLDGSLAIGEIAQRPPGANITRMTGLAHDIDGYRAWARAVVDGVLDAPWHRKYAVGCAFVRGMGDGRVTGVTGIARDEGGGRQVRCRLPHPAARHAEVGQLRGRWLFHRSPRVDGGRPRHGEEDHRDGEGSLRLRW